MRREFLLPTHHALVMSSTSTEMLKENGSPAIALGFLFKLGWLLVQAHKRISTLITFFEAVVRAGLFLK
jgi:hypothetical protein